MRNIQATILNEDDDASKTGDAVDAGQLVSASFCAIFGDTDAAGTVKIQCSNWNPAASGYRASADGRTPRVPPESTWCDVPNATTSITSGVGSAIVIPNMAFSYIRAVFTSSNAGATTVEVQMNALSM